MQNWLLKIFRMPSVYITGKIAQSGITLLESRGFEVNINTSEVDLNSTQLKEIFSKYDAVVTMINNKIDKGILSGASKNLKIIANYAVGYDNIDLEATKKKKITVTNTPGVASESVAEHAFALIISLNKHLFAADQFVRMGKFSKFDPNLFLSHQLWGQTIGIIGLGRIGTFVGQIAYGGFRMKVLYFDVKPAEDFELLCEAKFSDVETILKESDIVTLHVPLTSKTKHLISKNEFKMMRKSAILVNTCRGPVVDEEALVWALSENEIAGCGLDVFEHEPQISKELTRSENVILTPHTASATYETREAMAKIAVQNIIDVFEGRIPFGLVKVS